MALKQRLQIRQSQNLSLTPQLMQSIKLLQLSHLELASFVNKELERNPLLERDEGEQNIEASASEKNLDLEPDSDFNSQNMNIMASAAQIAQDFDTDKSNLFPEQVGQDSISQSTGQYDSSNSTNSYEYGADIDSYIAAKKSLSEYLHEQISLMFKDKENLIIAHQLVNNLDEKGYLDSSIEDIAAWLGVGEQKIEQVLEKLQTCEPLGVFARDLRECLAIQLKERNRFDPLMEKLLENLHLVAAHNFSQLGKKIGASKEDISDMLLELRELDPKPALAFDGAPSATIIADVFVREGNNQTWNIELNSEILPKVLVNQDYYATIRKKLRNGEEKSFLTDCMQSANWLTKSLDQRAKTILKVATQIVSAQDGFLRHGIAHLKPMTLKMVADELQMHESTISRVTANKYISTPRGLFEMKFFFTSALSSNIGGDEHSSEAIKYKIKTLIDEEDAKSIFSDDKLAEILQQDLGVDIARRTVAKYREAMNIPSSIIRRRQKKLC